MRRLLTGLLLLACLAPGATAAAEPCEDRAAGDCSPDCSVCLCCAPAPSSLPESAQAVDCPPAAAVASPAVLRPRSPDPRDIFHVPKAARPQL